MDYKILDDFLVMENHPSTLFFDSSSLLLFTEKTKDVVASISNFKNQKEGMQQDAQILDKKTPYSDAEKKVTLCFLVSNNCNLRCKYCYASGGSYLQDRGKMDNETVDASIEFISKNFSFIKRINISFFGGEPLFYPKVIHYFIERAKAVLPNIKFHYSLTTNGTILNDFIFSILKENKIHFQISLDGDKIFQDTLRITKNGLGSYDRIIKNLEKFKTLTDRLSFRATITPKNLFLSKIYNHFKELGAKSMHFEIIGTSSDDLLYFNQKCIEKYKVQLNKLTRLYYQDFLKEENPVHISNFTKIFKFLHYGLKKSKFCGAFTNLIAINFKGVIYPCHRFVGMNNYKFGDVSQKFELHTPKRLFEIEQHPSCKKCFARNLCAGGCHYNATFSKPEKLFSSPHCQVYRHIISLAIWLYANLIQSNKKEKFLEFFQLKSL